MRVLGFQSVGVTVVALGLLGGLSLIPESAEAQRRGGGRGGGGFRGGGGGGFGGRGGAARTSVNRDFARPANRDFNRNVSRDVGRNVSRNVNRDVNRNVNRDWDVDVDVDRDWHPVARAAAWGTAAAVTAAAIGSVVYTLPSSCVVTVVNGISYQQCGGVWYAPQFEGSTVSYVVVSPP
jgi:hypothetical protein